MSQIKTIFENISWLLISQIIASVCAFIWTILIARYLGVNDYGIYGFAISLTGMMAFVTDFGISTHVVRHIATNNDSASKYLGNTLPLKSFFGILAIIFILIILILMKSDELTITITFLFAIEMIIKSIMGLLTGTFQAFEKGKYQGIGNTISNLLLLTFILISIFTDYGLYGIAISYILANVIAFSYEYFALNKFIVKPKFQLDLSFCKKIIKLALPFAITGLLTTIYYSIDVIMLNNMVGNYATGLYNAAFKLISVLTLFYGIYSAVFFPVMSKFYKNDKKLLIISFEKSVKYLMFIIIPIATLIMFYSADIIQLIFGQEYYPSASVLSILIWTICLLFISGACNNLLNASHLEVSVTKIYFVVAVFNVVFNFFMIPNFSSNGAAVTTVLSELIIVVLQVYVIYKSGQRINKKTYFDLLKVIGGTIILTFILYLLNLNMWVAIPFSIIIYITIIILLRFFDNEDKYIIKEIFNKN